MPPTTQPHPDFESLVDSWQLGLDADGYSERTLKSYGGAVGQLATWLAGQHPDTGPLDVTRDQMRAWIVHVRETRSSGTARSWFAGVRHFYQWLVKEGEATMDPTEGIKTPRPNDPTTPVLTVDQVRRLLDTCRGNDFGSRRDAAIIYLLVDCGLRLAEITGLTVNDYDLRSRVVFVEGKGSNRSGPRRRAVSMGVKAAQALDRYLRERRRHVFADQPQLWLGGRNRPTLSADGLDRMLERRGALIGLSIHPHMFRHTWASQFRSAGGEEGDLMVLGGWRSRAMLDRYGRAAAAERAQEVNRRKSLGDRL